MQSKNAGLKNEDIDLIIVATTHLTDSHLQQLVIVQDKIESYNAVAFDISDVHNGFLLGMSVAFQFITSGVYDKFW